MRNALILSAALLALAGCGSAPDCDTVDAQSLVASMRPKEQFRAMLEQTVARTRTAAIASNPDALPGAIDVAVERYHERWEDNLVSAWSKLDSGELAQVCTAIARRDQETYIGFATRVGVEAQAKNEPLLTKAGVEVLAAIY